MLRRIAPETNALTRDVCSLLDDRESIAGDSTNLLVACKDLRLAPWRRKSLVIWACRLFSEDVEHQLNAFKTQHVISDQDPQSLPLVA